MHHDMNGGIRPLAELKITEWFGEGSTDLSRVAVSFAGLLASRFGAEVLRVEESMGDPIRGWPPILRDKSSATFAFLTQGKTFVERPITPVSGFLLTDDPARIAKWPSEATVLIRPHSDSARKWSELTIQAASGLLDILGDSQRAPLALPGHQIAYATGMAAFNALMAAYLGQLKGIAVERSEVTASDVALWVNWKHCMAASQGSFDVGRARHEEWKTVACRDGYVTLVFQDKDVAKLAQLTGNETLVTRNFSDRPVRAQHFAEFMQIISSWMSTRSRQEIVTAARKLAIPIGPVLEVDELQNDSQLRERAFFERSSPDARPTLRLPFLWQEAGTADR